MNVNWCAVLIACWLTLPGMAQAQGFAGLGTNVEGFANVEPGVELIFPTDHGSHPDYRIEWWYLTANMTGPDGTAYGLQWTLFRSALSPDDAEGWANPQLWMGHAAVTTPTDHFVAERLGRGGIGQAGVTLDPFTAWIDDWSLTGDWQSLQMQASGGDFAYDVELTAQGPLVFHGDKGFSVKSADGQASYYYSQPFFDLSGTLILPDQEIPVMGTAWLDREWSSQPLSEDQTGWDWFSLSFDSGAKLMGFRLQQRSGQIYTSATWIEPNGETTAYGDGAFSAQPLVENQTTKGGKVPVRWRIGLPDRGVDVTVSALNPDAWMTTTIPYWEGPVTVTGSHVGHGYLEMTGYE